MVGFSNLGGLWFRVESLELRGLWFRVESFEFRV